MTASKLTDAKLRGLQAPSQGQAEYRDSDVPGLRARIGVSGAIAFTIRKRIDGKLRNITIGRFGPNFGIVDARRKARALLNDVEAGDGIRMPAQRVRSSASTIAEMFPNFLADKSGRRSIGEMERIMRKHVLPVMGDRLADRVTRKDVSDLVRDVAASSPSMARAVHAQLSSFYGWALPDLPRLAANPCIGARRPDKPEARDRVLSDDELAALWFAAEDLGGSWGAAIKLLMLTATRRDEVFQADWDEFDLTAAEWTIPGSRAKNAMPHIVPLVPAAIDVINSIVLIDGTSKLFPARGKSDRSISGYSKGTAQLRKLVDARLKREVADRWTLHDIRRSVATRMQGLGVRFEVVESLLNHVSGSRGGVAGIYQRHDWKHEKRAALKLWADAMQSILRKGADVLPFETKEKVE